MNIDDLKKKLTAQGFPIVYDWTDAPNTAYSEHQHIGKVSFYVTRGSVIFDFSGEKKIISAGEYIDVPVQTKHTALVSPEGCDYVVGQEIEGDA